MAAIEVTLDNADINDIANGGKVLVRNSNGVPYVITRNVSDSTIDCWKGLKIVDQYPTIGSSIFLYSGARTSVSQSFSGDGQTVDGLSFAVAKFGSPTGTVTFAIYDHSGTFGTSSIPTGSPLVSGTFDVSTLTETLTLKEVSVAEYTLTAATKYTIVASYSGGDASNYFRVAAVSDAHDGNYAYYIGSWSSVSGTDLSFKVHSPDYASFEEQDASAPKPTGTNYGAVSAAIDSDDVIHIAYMSDAGKASPLLYATFRADGINDDWLTTDVSLVADIGEDPTAITNLFTAIAIDSSDVPHIVFNRYLKIGGASTFVLSYINKVGGTWGTVYDIHYVQSAHCYFPDLSIDYDDKPAVTFIATSACRVAIGNVNNATLFTTHSVETDVSNVAGSICIDSDGNHWVSCRDGSPANVNLHKHNYTDGWTTWQSLVTNSNVGDRSSLYADGTDIYIFYENDANEIAYDMYNGSTWEGETVLETVAEPYNTVRVSWASWVFNDSTGLIKRICDFNSNHSTSGGGGPLDADTSALSQSFTGDGGEIDSVSAFIYKNGSPTGNIVAKLYEHSGTYGTSSVPTGAALATSGVIDVSTLTTDPTGSPPEKFSFSTPYQTVAGTKYCLVLEYPDGTADDRVRWMGAASSHDGNEASYTSSTWTANSTFDSGFYVFNESIITEISYVYTDESSPYDIWFNVLELGDEDTNDELVGTDIVAQSPTLTTGVVTVPDTNDELVGTDITSQAPVLDTGALNQEHNLTAADVTSQAPVLDTGALSQEYNLTATDITSQAPVLDTGTLNQGHNLTAIDVTSQAPVLDTGALNQEHNLTATDVTSQAPVLDTGALNQEHNLTATNVVSQASVLDIATLVEDTNNELSGIDITSQAPVLDTGTLAGDTNNELTGASITSHAPVLDTGILNQEHNLTATDVTSQVPVLDTGILNQGHNLTATDVTSQAPVLDTGILNQEHELVGTGVIADNPILTTATIIEDTNNELVGADIISQAPVLDVGTLTGDTNDNLTGSNIASQAPILDTGTLTQEHDLTAADVTSQAPVLDTGILNQGHDLTAADVTSQAPVLDTGILNQGHDLVAADTTSQASILNTGILNQEHNLAAADIASQASVLDTATLIEDTNNELVGIGITSQAPTLSNGILTGDTDHLIGQDIIAIGVVSNSVDSYEQAVSEASIGIWDSRGFGQSFEGDSRVITKAIFKLRKGGAPPFDLTAHIYDYSGVYGESSIPTGPPLVSSVTIAANSLATSYEDIEFVFDSEIVLDENVHYVIAVQASPGGDISNYIQALIYAWFHYPTHPGNSSLYDTLGWGPEPNEDFYFNVLADSPVYPYVDNGTLIQSHIGYDIISGEPIVSTAKVILYTETLLCTVRVYDPADRMRIPISWPIKDEGGLIVFTIDWLQYAESDPIVLSMWDLDDNFFMWESDSDSISTIIGIGGGEDRTKYSIRNTVTLLSGVEYTEIIKFNVNNRLCSPELDPTYASGAELRRLELIEQ